MNLLFNWLPSVVIRDSHVLDRVQSSSMWLYWLLLYLHHNNSHELYKAAYNWLLCIVHSSLSNVLRKPNFFNGSTKKHANFSAFWKLGEIRKWVRSSRLGLNVLTNAELALPNWDSRTNIILSFGHASGYQLEAHGPGRVKGLLSRSPWVFNCYHSRYAVYRLLWMFIYFVLFLRLTLFPWR